MILRTIGVLATEQIAVGLVEDHQMVGAVRVFPEAETGAGLLEGMHAEEIIQRIHQEIELVRQGEPIAAVGVGFPGITRDGMVEECPNLPQVKGQNLAAALTALLHQSGLDAPVHVLNDADAMAAGIAAARGQLDKLTRVWFLGNGIGFGRYPQGGIVGEGGHIVVTLDPKERYCQCGGVGHLEGIMGHRAMRLRFLDLEPEEVFEQEKSGDPRCVAFVNLWHRALAAATASSIHLDGPGKFFISGPNARFVQTHLVQIYLEEMVKMSPLQGSTLEVIPTGNEIAIVGAAVSALRVASTRQPAPL
jgi:predicted NBD/HSP70 family sugar kinase